MSSPTEQGIWNPIVERLRRGWRRVTEYLARRRQYRELTALDRDQLRDIGLVPADLAAVADGTFFNDPSRRQRYQTPSHVAAANWTTREQPGIRTHAACASANR
jgi:uncharacterized protein YjiS (DUF1127 family)